MQVLTADVEDKMLLDFIKFDIEDLFHNRLFLRKKNGSQKYVSDKTIASKTYILYNLQKSLISPKLNVFFLSLTFIKE